jgi:hypothetical protein
MSAEGAGARLLSVSNNENNRPILALPVRTGAVYTGMNTTNNAAAPETTAPKTLGSFFEEAIAFEAMRAARLKALRAARIAVAGAVK